MASISIAPMAHKDWSLFASINDLMEIAELVAPFFRSKVKDNLGVPARFISVTNIDYTKEDYGEIIQYNVDIHLHSDQGQLVQPIIIREFQIYRLMEEELDRYTEIEERCLLFPDLDPDPMIYINKENQYLIYEKTRGYSIDDLPFSQEVTDFLVGRISAILQGSKIMPLNENTIREMLIFLLVNQPFTDEERESIAEILEGHFAKIAGSTGGYIPCTLFNPSSFVFTILNEISSIDTNAINKGKSVRVFVSNALPENISNDRISDIADYYHSRIYKEYLSTGKIFQTKTQIKNFLLGYTGVTKVLKVPTFKEMYLQGNTLELQFLTSAWLEEAEKIRDSPINYDDFESRNMLQYSYYLLIYFPFSDLIG